MADRTGQSVSLTWNVVGPDGVRSEGAIPASWHHNEGANSYWIAKIGAILGGSHVTYATPARRQASLSLVDLLVGRRVVRYVSVGGGLYDEPRLRRFRPPMSVSGGDTETVRGFTISVGYRS